jgi:hypothetical protein
MSNFDLRKYLAEGRLYKENVSPIKEGTINLSSEDNAIIDFVTNRAEELLSSGNYSDGELISKSPYKTADGKDATVEFYLKSYGEGGLGFLIPGKSDDLNDQKIVINTNFFGSAFGPLGKIIKATTGKDPKTYLRDLIVHEFIHAKDPRVNHIPLKEPDLGTAETYYGSWGEFPAFTGGLFEAIEDSTKAFLEQNGGVLYAPQTEYLSNIYQDILDYYAGYDKEISNDTLEFFDRSGKNTFQKFVNSIVNLFLSTVGLPRSPLDAHISAIEQVKKYNPEGYKEFQKDLYKTIQSIIDRLNKKSLGPNKQIPPIQAGGKSRTLFN